MVGPGRSVCGALCRGLTQLFREVPGKQSDAVPPGAGLAPKRDPEQRTGFEAEGSPLDRVRLIAFGIASPQQLRLSTAHHRSPRGRRLATAVAFFVAS